ncbi:PAS domain-containing protein [Methanosphaerula palustris]|uniref:Putative PAS/PAC sensor protein n=1 Tax=Methanosphaerula palustris (strain ATCC BAA-1556 / DSM 19958 / E1-9c) TaxID=521011 RepID=B8GGT0_METPE|nr:PAS domain S-box protein [Methanosphaerula palustris]ACL16335.1 putative PAS/PAC sensor protein [Methanosphaerula palustris E1-9c]
MPSDEGTIVSFDLLSQIKSILKNNPKGMSVTDISHKLKMNRNSVAKYLDILSISGQVEMRTFGPAKVYFLSQRVPLGAMLNHTSEFILVLDSGLRVIQINDRFLVFLKEDRDYYLGKTLEETVIPIVSEQIIMDKIQETFTKKEVMLEVQYTQEDGDLFFRVKLISTVFDDGTPGVTIILEEITSQKRAEIALKESEQRFREMVEVSPYPISIIDPHGTYLFINSKFTEVFGYTRDEITSGRDWFSAAYPDETYRKQVIHAWITDIEQAGERPISPRLFQVTTRSGEVKEVIFRTVRLSDQNHYITYEDISERRRVEEALAEQKRVDEVVFTSVQRTREIAERSLDLLFGLDPEGKITQVSPSFERITSYSLEEVRGRMISDLIQEAEIPLSNEFFRLMHAGEEIEGIELHLIKKDGSVIPMMINLVPKMSGTTIVGIQGKLLWV